MDPAKQAEPEEHLTRMSFGDHLEELRKRVLRALLAVVVCVAGVMPFKTEVGEIVLGPYRGLWRMAFQDWIGFLQERQQAGTLDDKGRGYLEFCTQNCDEILAGEYEWYQAIINEGGFQMPYQLTAIGGLEDFWIFMKMAFVLALVLASPVVIYQAWAFVGAGLYKKERTVVYRFLPLSIGLMMTGVLFGYFVVVRYALYFLAKMASPDQTQMLLTVSLYFDLLFMVTAALGIVFQLPLVMLALNRIGIVSHDALKKNWRYVILGIFVVAAFATPPDPFTQTMMAVPMTLLYAFGLLLTSRSERRLRAVAGEA